MNRKLKLAYIGWAHSIHTQRWVTWFAKRGHEVHLITDHPYPIDGIKIYELKRGKNIIPINIFRINFKLHLLSTYLKIRRLVKEIAPDILHLHTLYFPSYLGSLVNFKPIVVMPWNGDIIWKQNRSFFHECIVKRSLRLADAIPLQTDYLKDRCVELGADKKKIELVQFGVDFDRFKFDGSAEYVKHELKLDTNNIVITTRSIAYNISTIVESIPMVTKAIPDAKFVFIWPNTEKESSSIVKRIKELGIENSVRIVGRITVHNDVAKYLFIAKTFVSVSEIDCFPQSALEAMAMKVFPVMGDIAPIREYITDKINGILVNPIDVNSVAKGIIDSLIMSKDGRADIVERNYQFVRNQADFNKEMQKMESLYYKLLEESKK